MTKMMIPTSLRAPLRDFDRGDGGRELFLRRGGVSSFSSNIRVNVVSFHVDVCIVDIR